MRLLLLLALGSALGRPDTASAQLSQLANVGVSSHQYGRGDFPSARQADEAAVVDAVEDVVSSLISTQPDETEVTPAETQADESMLVEDQAEVVTETTVVDGTDGELEVGPPDSSNTVDGAVADEMTGPAEEQPVEEPMPLTPKQQNLVAKYNEITDRLLEILSLKMKVTADNIPMAINPNILMKLEQTEETGPEEEKNPGGRRNKDKKKGKKNNRKQQKDKKLKKRKNNKGAKGRNVFGDDGLTNLDIIFESKHEPIPISDRSMLKKDKKKKRKNNRKGIKRGNNSKNRRNQKELDLEEVEDDEEEEEIEGENRQARRNEDLEEKPNKKKANRPKKQRKQNKQKQKAKNNRGRNNLEKKKDSEPEAKRVKISPLPSNLELTLANSLIHGYSHIQRDGDVIPDFTQKSNPFTANVIMQRAGVSIKDIALSQRKSEISLNIKGSIELQAKMPRNRVKLTLLDVTIDNLLEDDVLINRSDLELDPLLVSEAQQEITSAIDSVRLGDILKYQIEEILEEDNTLVSFTNA